MKQKLLLKMAVLLLFIMITVGCSDYPNGDKINKITSGGYSIVNQPLNKTINLAFSPKEYLSKEIKDSDKVKYNQYNTTLIVDSIEEREKDFYIYIKIKQDFPENNGTIITPSRYTLSNGGVTVGSSLDVIIKVDDNLIQETNLGHSTDRIGFGIEKDVLKNAETINVQIQNMNIFKYAKK